LARRFCFAVPNLPIALPHDKICQLIVSERTGKPIDAMTLRSAFRAELDRGVAVADAAVANALYNNAVHITATTSPPRFGGACFAGKAAS
jgi:hypothetical protein